MKDAVYSAIGVAAPILNGKFDFNLFLSTNIMADLQNPSSSYSIVRRRIAILITRWIPIDVQPEKRPLVYEIFQTLLDPSNELNNQAVRITAGKRLRDVVDEMTFNAEQFQPYMSTIMNRLLDLIREANMAETKLSLLYTVSTIVSRMSHDVSPFADQVVSILQNLWVDAGSESLMKAAIVNILKKLVRSMGLASVPIHAMMLPTVAATVEPGSELQVYLLEDALDLWIVILENTPAPASEQLIAMTQYLPPILKDEDYVERALRITRSYALLAPTQMLQVDIRDRFFSCFQDLLDVKKTSVIDSMCGVVELMIRAAEGRDSPRSTNGGVNNKSMQVWEDVKLCRLSRKAS